MGKQEKKEGFDILRLIEHGNICYISSEYLPGKQLIYWLKEGKILRKGELYQWIRDMVKQLMRIYRCQDSQGYGFVNPYCILISEDCRLYYLDMDAKSNEETLKQMRQDPVIRYYFTPEESVDCKQRNVKGELYGMGKTLQYILSVAYIRPELTKREERKLRKFISKCLGQTGRREIQDVSELLTCLPEPAGIGNSIGIGRSMKNSMKIGIAVAVLAVATGVRVLAFKEETSSSASKENVQEHQEMETIDRTGKESVKDKEAVLEQSGKAIMQLALNYYLELDRPEKALSVLEDSLDELKIEGEEISKETEKVQEETQEMNALICVIQAYVNPEDKLSHEEDFRTVAKALEVIEDGMDVMEDQGKVWCLVRGYGLLMDKSKDLAEANKESSLTSEYANQVITIGEEQLQELEIEFPTEKTMGVNVNLLEGEEEAEGDNIENGEEDDKENRKDSELLEKALKEISQTIAKAYESKGNLQVAIQEWKVLLNEANGWGEREAIYLKLEELYEADGQTDKAIDTCVQGLEACYESWALRKIHIRLLCSDKGMDRGVCAQTIKEYLGQYPDLKEDEEFKELQEKYGIKIEGDTVTVK